MTLSTSSAVQHEVPGDVHSAAAPHSVELKRGGFLASYPPFESLKQGGQEGIWKGRKFGLYVHLPYCRKRCTFCFYKVYTNRVAKPMEDYLAALYREIEHYGARPEIASRVAHSLYFGGGTPTTLTVDQLRDLVAHIHRHLTLAPDFEFTCESEPGTLDAEKLACLREIGVTRLSIGVQSFDDDILHKNGRSHGTKQVFKAMELARENAFPVINIDLMTGCVDETPETWERSLETLIGLAPEHVSIYRMEIYKNTLMYAAGYTGPGVGGVPTDEEEHALWFRAVERLEGAGYTQVKGHAFVKRPEHIHTHRVDAWGGGDVLGMGVGSYSYLNNCVFQNSSSWDDYVAKAGAGESPVERWLPLNTRQLMAREIILGLKLFRVDRTAFQQRHGFDAVELYPTQVAGLVADGLLDVSDEAIVLTRKGYAYVDVICSQFYLPEHAPQAFTRFATEDELAQAADLGASLLGAAPAWQADPTATAATTASVAAPGSVPNGRDLALSTVQG